MTWTIEWDGGHGQIEPLAGMLGPVWFSLPSGRSIQPFAIAPWSDDDTPEHDELPPILKRLRGEWPCVPFGVPDARTDLPGHWLEGLDTGRNPPDDFIHGFSSNHDWELVTAKPGAITIKIDYPETHPVRRLTRTIRGHAGRAQLDISLKIETRQRMALPVGLHPVFALPASSGGAVLEFSGLGSVHSYPVDTEAGVSVIEPDQRAEGLDGLKVKAGGTLDASRLPLPHAAEELLLVEGHGGRAILRNEDEGYQTQLTWDESVFPSCLLWISNGGRTAYPWNGRFNAIGIEPVAAAFDLGHAHSLNDQNPLRRAGLETALHLSPDRPFETNYSIALSDL
ncbi:MAG: hypothetical protein NXI27_10860 [Alphaproteobacteria bacterium]|nr:hypothetical protein [Alphaproteobacteria bacterium]